MSGVSAVHSLEDPFAFARSASEQRGEFAVKLLTRLQDRLASTAGSVSYKVRGCRDRRERFSLALEIHGKLELQCGWCMAPVDYPLQIRTSVLLAEPGKVPQENDDPADPEWIEAGHELNLMELMEDEILLGLPVSVRHARTECQTGNLGQSGTHAAESPFARLASLQGTRQTHTR